MNRSAAASVPSRRWKSWLSLAVLLVLAVWAGTYVTQNLDRFRELELSNGSALLVMVLAYLARHALQGLELQTLSRILRVRLRWFEATLLSLCAALFDIITPLKGGLATKVFYLRTRHGLTYSRVAALLAGSQVLVMSGAALVGLFAGLAGMGGNANGSAELSLFFFLALIVLILLSWIWDRVPKRFRFPMFDRVLTAWHQVRGAHAMVAANLAFAVIKLCLRGIMVGAGFAALGHELGVAQGLLLAAALEFSVIFSITPAGLGVTESVITLVGVMVGVDAPVALGAALLWRTLGVAMAMTFGSGAYLGLFHSPVCTVSEQGEIRDEGTS